MIILQVFYVVKGFLEYFFTYFLYGNIVGDMLYSVSVLVTGRGMGSVMVGVHIIDTSNFILKGHTT